MESSTVYEADIIGGFPYADPNCQGCGKPLTVENAWMTDGCPCNSPLGVNSMNETRWRLLMELQQRQARHSEELTDALRYSRVALHKADTDICDWQQLARRQREIMPDPDRNPICPTDRGIQASESVKADIGVAFGKIRGALGEQSN